MIVLAALAVATVPAVDSCFDSNSVSDLEVRDAITDCYYFSCRFMSQAKAVR